MTRLRIRRRGSAATVALVVAIAVVVGSGSAAFALWSASGTTQSSATLGKVSGGITGTSSMTTTFSPTVSSATAPVTLTATGSLGGTYRAAATVATGSALAAAVHVDAWPVATTDACTASAAVGSPAVAGTWTSLPALSGSLAAGASAVWCIRSSPTSSAPASATSSIKLAVTVTTTTGSWVSAAVSGGFYLNTSADFTAPAPAPPALTCSDYDGSYHVKIAWDTSQRPLDTYYGLAVAGTRIDSPAQGYTGYIDLSGSDVPTSVAADGPARIDVDVLDSSQQPTGQIAATGGVTLGQANGSRTVVCGGGS